MNPELILKKYAPNEKDFDAILRHCRKVAEIAVRLAKTSRVPVDIDFVKDAALLHDIGRFQHPHKDTAVFHGVVGAEIMLKEGFPKIARVCECHVGPGIPMAEAIKCGLPAKDYCPKTVEEKIVCYADKIVAGDKEITFQQAYDRFLKELGPDVAKRLQRLHDDVMKLLR